MTKFGNSKRVANATMTGAPHCIHECVCSFYKSRNGEFSSEPCDLNTKDTCPHSSTTSAEKVLEQIEKIISDRIQELKYPASGNCVREAILGENQALWAQIKELQQQAERERG